MVSRDDLLDRQGDPRKWYPRFSAAEHARRLESARHLAQRAGLAALIIHGNVAARQDVHYLSNFLPRHDTYLYLPVSGHATLFVQLFNHVPNAVEMSVVDDVRWGGVSSPTTLANHLRTTGLERDVIGIVGQPPYQHRDELGLALPHARLTDVTGLFRRMRLIKSHEEIARTREGARVSDAGMQALIAGARPGMTDHELGALVEGACARAGGQHGICFLASAPMVEGGRANPAQNWAQRMVTAGDIVMMELSAGSWGYTGQILRTLVIGTAPTPLIRRLHEVAVAAYRAIESAIQPGVPATALLERAAIIEDAGFTVCDDVVHGYQGGYLPPILRTPATQHGPAPEIVLEPGMMLVIQPNVITKDGRHGVQTGQLVLVTAAGVEPMHDISLELFHRAVDS